MPSASSGDAIKGPVLVLLIAHLAHVHFDREDAARGRHRVHGGAAGLGLLWSARRDARRYPAGRLLEPRTFVERTA